MTSNALCGTTTGEQTSRHCSTSSAFATSIVCRTPARPTVVGRAGPADARAVTPDAGAHRVARARWSSMSCHRVARRSRELVGLRRGRITRSDPDVVCLRPYPSGRERLATLLPTPPESVDQRRLAGTEVTGPCRSASTPGSRVHIRTLQNGPRYPIASAQRQWSCRSSGISPDPQSDRLIYTRVLADLHEAKRSKS